MAVEWLLPLGVAVAKVLLRAADATVVDVFAHVADAIDDFEVRGLRRGGWPGAVTQLNRDG